MTFITGTYRYTLDDKNRVKFPARFQEALGDSPVMAPGVGGRINVYPKDMFERMHPKLYSPDPYNEAEQDATTFLLTHLQTLEYDGQGRITVDASFREDLHVEKELVFVGKVSYVEVWPAQLYDSREELLDPASITKMLKSLSKTLDEANR